MRWEAVRPCDCVLAIGLSRTAAGLEADIADPRKEYARLAGGIPRGNPPTAAQLAEARTRFAKIEALFDEVIASVTAAEPDGTSGVTVVDGVTLHELGRLLAASPSGRVIALVAHWDEPEITESEVLDVSAVLAAVRERQSARFDLLRADLCDLGGAASWFEPAAADRDPDPAAVARALNAVLLPARLFQRDAREAPRCLTADGIAPPRPKFTRVMLERMLGPDAIAPCAPMELADGLHRVDDFLEALPEEFAGTLHLLACSSEYLGELARDRCPDASILMARVLRTPPVALKRYQLRIDRLRGRRRTSYEEADPYQGRITMSSVRTILQNAFPPPVGALGEVVVDRERLAAELRAARDGNEWLFRTAIIAALAMVAVSLFGIVWMITTGQPGVMKALTAAMGVPASALLFWMISVWRERDDADMLIALIPVLDDAELRKVVKVYLDRAARRPADRQAAAAN